jgi:hypothetical protein
MSKIRPRRRSAYGGEVVPRVGGEAVRRRRELGIGGGVGERDAGSVGCDAIRIGSSVATWELDEELGDTDLEYLIVDGGARSCRNPRGVRQRS